LIIQNGQALYPMPAAGGFETAKFNSLDVRINAACGQLRADFNRTSTLLSRSEARLTVCQQKLNVAETHEVECATLRVRDNSMNTWIADRLNAIGINAFLALVAEHVVVLLIIAVSVWWRPRVIPLTPVMPFVKIGEFKQTDPSTGHTVGAGLQGYWKQFPGQPVQLVFSTDPSAAKAEAVPPVVISVAKAMLNRDDKKHSDHKENLESAQPGSEPRTIKPEEADRAHYQIWRADTDEVVGHAVGLSFSHGDGTARYLVTNRHVIADLEAVCPGQAIVRVCNVKTGKTFMVRRGDIRESAIEDIAFVPATKDMPVAQAGPVSDLIKTARAYGTQDVKQPRVIKVAEGPAMKPNALSDVVHHHISTSFGWSGGGIFFGANVIAVHKSGPSSSKGAPNYAIPIDVVVKEIHRAFGKQHEVFEDEMLVLQKAQEAAREKLARDVAEMKLQAARDKAAREAELAGLRAEVQRLRGRQEDSVAATRLMVDKLASDAALTAPAHVGESAGGRKGRVVYDAEEADDVDNGEYAKAQKAPKPGSRRSQKKQRQADKDDHKDGQWNESAAGFAKMPEFRRKQLVAAMVKAGEATKEQGDAMLAEATQLSNSMKAKDMAVAKAALSNLKAAPAKAPPGASASQQGQPTALQPVGLGVTAVPMATISLQQHGAPLMSATPPASMQ